jgi:site-specific DNA recombinase
MNRPARATTSHKPLRVVLYVRVSSKDQEAEGFSIPAQLRLLREYASSKGFEIVREFEDVETAKASGRVHFTEMIQHLEKHKGACNTVLVEKTDRLTRNYRDWITFEELGTTIHFVKEGRVIGPHSPSADHLVHGFNLLIATNYIRNLREETRKGMTEKARSGIYPSYAPVGYRNVDGPNGKRIIVPDPDTASAITELFERFATGEYSIKRLATAFRSEGRSIRGRKLNTSLLHEILRKRIYTGTEFDWDGMTYHSAHEPLVTRECWNRVQELLNARAEKKTRKVKHDFAFSGLVRCGHCGCLMVGEIKKGRYVYYHCTGNRGKCPERFTRQETLLDEFGSILRELVIPAPVLNWLGDAVLESDRTEQAAREKNVERLQKQYDQIKIRIETMYMDKLDGRITTEFYDERAALWRREQEVIQRKIQDIQRAAPAPIDQAVDMLRLTSQACHLFLQEPVSEQRRLLQILIKDAAWKDGALRTTLFEPFDVLRHSNSESHRKEKEKGGSMNDIGIWLLR